MIHNLFQGQNPEYITFRFLSQQEIVIIRFFLEALTFAGETVPLQRLDVQEALRKELIINSYLHSHTIQILQTAPRVFQLMEPILEKNGIPEDFKYLAVIESRLNPQAQSPAGAVGVWQFLKGM